MRRRKEKKRKEIRGESQPLNIASEDKNVIVKERPKQ